MCVGGVSVCDGLPSCGDMYGVRRVWGVYGSTLHLILGFKLNILNTMSICLF